MTQKKEIQLYVNAAAVDTSSATRDAIEPPVRVVDYSVTRCVNVKLPKFSQMLLKR